VSGDGVVTAPPGSAAEVAEAFAASDPEGSRSRTLTWQDPVATAALGATMAGIDYMRAAVEGQVPPPPIAVTMRLRPIELEEGRVVFEGEPGEEHYYPIGVVHGGYARPWTIPPSAARSTTSPPRNSGYAGARAIRPTEDAASRSVRRRQTRA
jgi:hypothetical protein